MHFEYDIFLSFKTSNSEEQEWINRFKEHLTKVLTQLFNKKIKIISSADIQNSSEIMMTTGAFVAIITTEYLKDKLELSYLHEFHKLSQGKRIFKVVKELVDEGEETEFLAQSLPFDFHHAQLANNQTTTNDRYFKTEAERLYWLKVVDVAYNVYLSTVPQKSENRIKNAQKTVFVAEASPDQQKQRDIIIRELQYQGYNIVPQKPLPKNKIDFEQVVNDYITECHLSVHILGEKYGALLQNEPISRVEAQNKIAANIAKNQHVERLIWINPQLKDFEEKQQSYLQQLKKDIDELEGAELVETPLEIFKTIIDNKLTSENSKVNQTKLSKKSSKSIYIINGKEDEKNVQSLIEWVNANGYEPLVSNFDGDRRDVVENHRKNLADCDGAIIYYAHSNPQWIRTKLQDLIKAPGFGREKPMNFKAVYSTINEELPVIPINDLMHINQPSAELNKEGLKEITIKMS
jgi:hypothetical protein